MLAFSVTPLNTFNPQDSCARGSTGYLWNEFVLPEVTLLWLTQGNFHLEVVGHCSLVHLQVEKTPGVTRKPQNLVGFDEEVPSRCCWALLSRAFKN